MTKMMEEIEQIVAQSNTQVLNLVPLAAHVVAPDVSVAYPVMAPSQTEYHTGMPDNAQLANNPK